MELIKQDINIDFLSKRKAAAYFSIFLIAVGLISLIAHGGPNFGLDFTGGTQVQLNFEKPESVGNIRDALGTINLGTSEIKTFGNANEILITTEQKEETTNFSENITTVLSQYFPDNTIIIDRIENVGARIGEELRNKAVFSIGLALLFLIIYISWRFEFKFAIGAIIALMHDVFITVGFFSIFNKEITLPIVAALLTIVGYSLNDTIVVSDRIRENLKLLRREAYHIIINRSLNQTLSRTIITSLTTLIVVIILYISGSEIIKDFAFALIIGVTIGTYSSVFVATPIVVAYNDWQERKKRKR
ncbi:preprotein translocase subunit SecF [bacterium SM23_31]|nr:MAG: preprotein translocase subunit SecF [bacterium SM23_31]